MEPKEKCQHKIFCRPSRKLGWSR